MDFDASAARTNLARFWALPSQFGMERGGNHTYLNEIVSDRYALVFGLQVLRDELQLADGREGGDIGSCGANLEVPSVITTLAYTNCGDRIHQGEVERYRRAVAARFATLSEIGDVKLESFSPTGGGTDDGATLAHVTVAHQLDEPIRKRLYAGHAQSFVLVAIDLKTHVGRLDEADPAHTEGAHPVATFGRTRESPWREPRSACGAIVGALGSFNEANAVHRRIRSDLGEANFRHLTTEGAHATDGTDITHVVAAAIVAVQGMLNTAEALAGELDQRGVGHLTASVTVNRMSVPDPVIYLARTTVFQGEIGHQGFGTDARKYSGRMVPYGEDRRLVLSYDGVEQTAFPVLKRALKAKKSPH